MVRWKLALPIVTSSYLSNIPPFSSFHPDLWEEYFNVFQGFRQPTKRCVHPDPKSFGQSKIMVIKKPSHKSHSDRLHQAFEIILGVSTSTQKGSRSLSTSWAPQQILIPLPIFPGRCLTYRLLSIIRYHVLTSSCCIQIYWGKPLTSVVFSVCKHIQSSWPRKLVKTEVVSSDTLFLSIQKALSWQFCDRDLLGMLKWPPTIGDEKVTAAESPGCRLSTSEKIRKKQENQRLRTGPEKKKKNEPSHCSAKVGTDTQVTSVPLVPLFSSHTPFGV